VADGAVVAAGAVVNKDVPPYAVVVGNPARVVRYRFDQATIERLLAEKWWEQDLETIRQNLGEYTRDFGDPSRRVELTTVHDLSTPGP
jgi:virginiamycin A acetyltransferase